MSNEFETKLASAGEMFEKMVKESGLSVSDFTDQEAIDAITILMGGDAKTASAAPPAGAGTPPPAPAAPAPKTASQEQPKFSYGEVMAEVTKFAAAHGYDLTKASPAEIDDAVEKMAAHMAARQTPEFQAKEAAFKEKVAEADAMGRVMAHAYVDELGKIAAHTPMHEDKDEEKEKAEKKAALVAKLRGKTAGELPPALAAHMKGKHEGHEHHEHGKDHDEKEKHEKEEAEKKAAAFAKAASDRAAEKLILAGINPATGAKFASEEERIEAGANLVLSQKGYR